jgi:archaellum component FlaC
MMSSKEHRDLCDRIDALSGRTETRFGGVDLQLERIDRRFERVDERFEQVDRRFERIDERFEQVDRRFEQVDRRFERLETTLRAEIRESAVETRRYMDILYEKFHADVQRVFEGYDHQTTVLDDHERRIQALEHPRLSFEG